MDRQNAINGSYSNGVGKPTEEGESPVGETRGYVVCILSTIGHVESDGNTGGPSSKPKYYLMTDSGAVL